MVSFLTFLMYASLLSLYSTAASMLAGELMLGSFSIEITDRMMLSTPRIGLHRSSADSYEN